MPDDTVGRRLGDTGVAPVGTVADEGLPDGAVGRPRSGWGRAGTQARGAAGAAGATTGVGRVAVVVGAAGATTGVAPVGTVADEGLPDGAVGRPRSGWGRAGTQACGAAGAAGATTGAGRVAVVVAVPAAIGGVSEVAADPPEGVGVAVAGVDGARFGRGGESEPLLGAPVGSRRRGGSAPSTSSSVGIAGVRELRGNLAELLDGGEPLLVTRHGKLSGLYLPLDDPDRIPTELRRELAGVLGRHLSGLLEAKGVAEDDVQEDFDARRRRRR